MAGAEGVGCSQVRPGPAYRRQGALDGAKERALETAQLFAILTVVVVWGVAVYTIRRWGPGYARRSVRCPEKGVRAHVRVRQREAGFGELAATDVTAFSLLDGPLTCDKGCLARL